VDLGLPSAARRAAKAVAKNRVEIVLRLLFPVTLVEAALWTPRPPLRVLCGCCAVWFIVRQLSQRATSARNLGLHRRALMRGLWLLAPTVVLASAILAAAYFSGSLHRLWGLKHPWVAVAIYAVWAFLQEFILQCFCLRMLRALVSRVSSRLISGALFAMAHLPNPNLTLITFFAGIGFTAIYARKRNLYVVALIHAILGLTLAVSAPEAWFHGLRVGRDFFTKPSALATGISPALVPTLPPATPSLPSCASPHATLPLSLRLGSSASISAHR
jgi:membrane protease YdiL (CAAX protease family)